MAAIIAAPGRLRRRGGRKLTQRLQPFKPVLVHAHNGRVIIEPAAPGFDLATLLAGITPENRHGEADFGAPQGKEAF